MATPDPGTEARRRTFVERLGDRVGDLAIEFIGTFVAIGGIALADKLLEWWLGQDKRFFDLIPVRWVFDIGHLCLIARLIWRIFVPGKEEG